MLFCVLCGKLVIYISFVFLRSFVVDPHRGRSRAHIRAIRAIRGPEPLEPRRRGVIASPPSSGYMSIQF